MAALKSASSELEQVSNADSAALVLEGGAAAGRCRPDHPGGTQKPAGDDVIDAEYEVKK
ncbi:MAG: hypothetical protein U0791_12905 [Gemmataceae bacterium]